MPDFIEHEGEILPAQTGPNFPRAYRHGPVPIEDMPHVMRRTDEVAEVFDLSGADVDELTEADQAYVEEAKTRVPSAIGHAARVHVTGEAPPVPTRDRDLTSEQKNANEQAYIAGHDQRTSGQILRGQRP